MRQISLPSTMPAPVNPSAACEIFDQVARMLAAAHLRAEERAKATHARFNVFTTLLREHDEVRLHTRFLHCLLDPEGLHDCGCLFLDLFFKRLARFSQFTLEADPLELVCPRAADGWKVRKEAARSNGYGQIDLLLEHREFGIAIENKIHAKEQSRQLASYAAYLRERHGPNFRLIYLTLDGKDSDTHEGEPYLRISYADDILPWLEDCLRETYAIIPVNQLLLQYRDVVRKITGNTLETAMMKPIAEFVARNPDILRYRDQWSEAADLAKGLFLDRLAQGVIDALPGYQFIHHPDNEDGRFGTDDSGLFIRGKAGEPLLPEPFEVYFENSSYDGELDLGVFAGYDGKVLSKLQQVWLARMKLAWSGNAFGIESMENGATEPWPLGWIVLEELSDNRVADMMDPAGFPMVIEQIAERIKTYLGALQRTVSTVDQ